MRSDNKTIINAVKCWLKNAVIGLDLCPFAKKIFNTNQIRYQVSESVDTETLLLDVYNEIKFLDQHPATETTLVIVHRQLAHFERFNQFLDEVDDLLERHDWTGVFQVASFHPCYQFEGTHIADHENWTNRSPYPILHLLRESSVSQVIEKYPDIEQIPQININKMQALTNEQIERIFNANNVVKT